MKKLFFILVLLTAGLCLSAQNAAPRSAPFTAVKWLQYNPYVMVDGEWYLLVRVDDTDAKNIVDFCKKKYEGIWQKRFSEDFAEVLTAMGKTPNATVKLKLIKDSKIADRTLAMTTANRKKVWEYNNQNPDASTAKTKPEMVDNIQKDIASVVNIKNDKLYPFKSAMFEFKYTGHKLFSGSETVYIDENGKTVVIISDKPDGYTAEKTTIIWRANKCTSINHIKKSYFISPVRPKSTEPPVIAYSTPEQRKQGGYSKKADETILGKKCEVYEHAKMKVTYWLWKGFELQQINYALGNKMG